MTADELRASFLTFFENRGHTRVPSASLVPRGDQTLLLTGAGMVPFKPYFLGTAEPTERRVTTSQRCLRTPDIDHVGRTDRHGTFFEMLGNFSFGDYFKREAIAWAWEFVTEQLELSTDDLWVTVYEDDDEAVDLWRDMIGVPTGRIVRLGREDNFWEIGVGPCGPCSEIYLDRGEAHGCGKPDCRPGCDCDRFMEFWNLVFIQFHQDEHGTYTPLERKGIDTGMGLERAASLLQQVPSIFDTDIVRPIVDAAAKLAGVSYGDDPNSDASLRVITDHLRGVTFMAFDGIVPGNEGRGYVMRRLLRRAIRHGRTLGLERPFVEELVDVVVEQMSGATPELTERKQMIKKVLGQEEARFHETLDQGLSILFDMIETSEQNGATELSGADAFRLYDTFGFPLELTKEILDERGLSLDEAGFERAMKEQRSRARAARGETGYLDNGDAGELLEVIGDARSRFVGYTHLTAQPRVVKIVVGGELVETVDAGRGGTECRIVLDETPFYAESGGQVADVGTFTADDGRTAVDVRDVQRIADGVIVHECSVKSGTLAVGDYVTAGVVAARRRNTERHHTATHLLHKALREILGDHVRQAGSLVAPERLRFDFTHFEAIAPDELNAIATRVNEQILNNLPVLVAETSYEEATASGAMALFDEKYGDRVRVVSIGDYSKELCGGTHVRHTGELGLFKIVGESAVAAGVRRVEAVAGRAAWSYVNELEGHLRGIAERLDVPPARVPEHVDRVLARQKDAEREIGTLKRKLALADVDRVADRAERMGDVWVLADSVEGVDPESLRDMGDALRSRLDPSVIVLGSAQDGRVQLLAMATKRLVGQGIHVGKMLKHVAGIVGGGGGGRPDVAQAGGKDASKLPEALAAAKGLVQEQLLAGTVAKGQE